jgi:glycosyltransferase involved in cell wall biosynthesis
LKIGMIAARYAPEFEGGSERVVRALARGLFARGHELTVVCGTDRPVGREECVRENVEGIDVVRIPLRESEAFDLELARPRVEALVSKCFSGCELVHLHHWSTLSQRLVRKLAPMHPVLVTLHDAFASCPRFFRASPLGLDCPPRGEFSNCARCIETQARPLTALELKPRLAMRASEFEAEIGAAARWIVPSEFHGERMASLLGLDRERRVVLAPGLTRGLRRRPRAVHGSAGTLRLLHFGNLCEEKGSLDLVRAVARLPKGCATLTLAGRALSPGFGAEVERLGGASAIALLGPYDSNSLATAAAQADLAVFPTRVEESYGLVLDEAHALGLPVWSSNAGAMPERLLAGERSLPACDPLAWAEALERLVGRERDVLEAIRRRLETFRPPGVEDSVREHEALYTEVLSGVAA